MEIIFISSDQPPLRFKARMSMDEDFHDPHSEEIYLRLSAYHDDDSRCIILCKESNFVLTNEQGLIPLNKKYIVIPPDQKRHPELFSFCYDNSNRSKRISMEYINFLQKVGQVICKDKYAFFLSPMEAAK